MFQIDFPCLLMTDANIDTNSFLEMDENAFPISSTRLFLSSESKRKILSPSKNNILIAQDFTAFPNQFFENKNLLSEHVRTHSSIPALFQNNSLKFQIIFQNLTLNTSTTEQAHTHSLFLSQFSDITFKQNLDI